MRTLIKNFTRGAADVFLKGWSIGIYTGKSPCKLIQHPGNPVISAGDVTDAPACFTADPFIISHKDEFYMFFEVLNAASGRGEIGLAKSRDCFRWKYEKIVLKEKFHLSYPLVFCRGRNYYMVPESFEANSIRLYRANDFPFDWQFETDLKNGSPYCDPTVFRHDGIWWLYAFCRRKRELRLFYSRALHAQDWKEHPASPVITGRYSRPGGRVLICSGRIFRFSQDPVPVYGKRITAHEVKKLTPEAYVEEPVKNNLFEFPRLTGWNETKMHHVDFLNKAGQSWIAAADGCSGKLNTEMKIFCYRLRHFGRIMRKMIFPQN